MRGIAYGDRIDQREKGDLDQVVERDDKTVRSKERKFREKQTGPTLEWASRDGPSEGTFRLPVTQATLTCPKRASYCCN